MHMQSVHPSSLSTTWVLTEQIDKIRYLLSGSMTPPIYVLSGASSGIPALSDDVIRHTRLCLHCHSHQTYFQPIRDQGWRHTAMHAQEVTGPTLLASFLHSSSNSTQHSMCAEAESSYHTTTCS